MDVSVVKDMISVIRAERDRRLALLAKVDPEVAYDLWSEVDEPFVNDLCLMLLVSIRHTVERELVKIAALVTSDGRDLDGDQYRQRIQDERKKLREKGWTELVAKLKLIGSAEWDTSIETLRLLANIYKHSPQVTPDQALLKHLGLDFSVSYAPLPESQALRAGLAVSLGLQGNSNYCDIADELLIRASRFLADVQTRVALSPVKLEMGSFNPSTFAH